MQLVGERPRRPPQVFERYEPPELARVHPVLALQQMAGNRAVASALSRARLTALRSGAAVQRTCCRPCEQEEVQRDAVAGAKDDFGEQRDALRSPRFAGDATLEACYADRARLRRGMSGPPVRKIQEALIELDYDLGAHGADSVYGPATARAVRSFKADEELGFTQFGDVGPGTMRRLDQLFSGRQRKGPNRRNRGGEVNLTARVEVLATDVGSTGGLFQHLFIVHSDNEGNRRGFRAGPGVCPDGSKPGGRDSIMSDEGPYDSTFIDFDPKAPAKVAMVGEAANAKRGCLHDQLSAIDSSCIPYEATGPNSNTVARTLLERCGIPQVRPDVIAVGWDDKLPDKG